MSRVQPRTDIRPPKTGKLTAAQKRALAGWRLNLVMEVGVCEWCNRTYSLACHEIARGVDRHKACMERCCILVLCNAPHGIRPSCHSVVGAWPREKQLALLYLRRTSDFNLERYWQVIDREKPEMADVDGWIRRLTGSEM